MFSEAYGPHELTNPDARFFLATWNFTHSMMFSLYYLPCPNGFICVMRVCTHWELHTGVFGLDWSDPKTEDEAKAEYGLANEVIESEWFK